MKTIIILGTLISVGLCDVAHLLIETTTEPQPPPRPYAFGYAAGRFPGHIDRTHSEVSDGSGVVRGSYSYVDPSQKIRTVEYVADKNGFHALQSIPPPPPPKDSAAVAAAKEKHLYQFQAIANRHQAGYLAVPADSAAVAHAKEAHLLRYAAIAEAHKVVPGQVVVPINSIAVQKATAKHHDLFARIAEEHARIAAEREAERLASEATAVPNHLEQEY